MKCTAVYEDCRIFLNLFGSITVEDRPTGGVTLTHQERDRQDESISSQVEPDARCAGPAGSQGPDGAARDDQSGAVALCAHRVHVYIPRTSVQLEA